MSLRASLIASHLTRDLPFTPGAGPNGGEWFLPWRQLQASFAARGVELHTPDVNAGHEVAFELHLNAQRAMRQPSPRPCYAYLYEDPIVRPINTDRAVLANYRKVFGSNTELVDGHHVLSLDYPNDLQLRDVPGWDGRDLHCVLIASNKALLHTDPRSLHATRVAVIREFERHAPGRFALFGLGWDIPPVRPGHWGRVAKRLQEWRRTIRPGPKPFPSYAGKAGHKSEVLDRARFAICFENSRGSPGYLTEKIFDCLVSGCVPVYIGSPGWQQVIPAAACIDADTFGSPRELREFLDAVTPAQFAAYQAAMRGFLAAPTTQRFSNAHFCRVIVDTILTDLGVVTAA